VLETAATVIGNAVERDRSRRAREAAEREILIAQERAARAAELEAANRVLRTRDRWLQTIAAAASELLSAAQPEVSVNTALQLIGENLECDRLCVMRYLPATEGAGGFGYFQLLYEWNAPGTISHMASEGMQTMPANDFADWTARLMAGEAVGGLAVEQGEPFRGSMLKLGALYAYAIPIFVGAEAGLEFWGVMFIDYCRETQLTPAEIAVFDTAATCVGSAIHREQMQRDRAQAERNALLEREREKAARARVAELARTNEAISKTLTTLAASPELDLFLGHILAEMAQKLGACKAHLFLYDRLANTLTQRVTVQDGRVYLGAAPRDPEMFARPIPADITPGWKYIIDSAKPLTHDENGAYDEEIWWPEALAWHKSQGHRAITCIPMKAGKQPVGFIGFCFYERIAFTDEQFEFMQALANQAIVAIQLTRLAEQSKNTALTDERNRLAREIHDTLAQAFTGISLQLEAVRGLTRKASAHPLDAVLTQAQPYIRRARDLARQGLSEARRSVRALRSEALETDTLPDALRKALAQTHRDTGLSTHFYLEGEPSPLPDDIQLNLLRIAQEAITNTLRHAQATQLDLTLSFTPRQVQLRIVDDGVGFDPVTLMEKTGFGIIGIRERTDYFYGTFNLQSTPNIGTTLEVLIPL
ncbi:MAG: GAF domain-containing sensor histidine kinase, partial [Cyanobacteria bacterium J06641_5]